MNPADVTTLMRAAVRHGLVHVEAGGLPFVGVVVGDGYVSDHGVNRVLETGDPSAHAEIVAVRRALQDLGRRDLHGLTLLATGEPCGLCYRVALEQGIGRIYVAVDADTVADLGFDYRRSYEGIDRSRLAALVTRLSVEGALEPFHRYLQLQTGAARA